MRFSMLPVLFLTGCAGLFGFEPTEGDYDVEIGGIDLSDACEEIWGYEATDDDLISVEVEVDDDEIEFVDYWEDCERDGVEFDCEYESSEPAGDGYDATFFVVESMRGEWTSATEFEGDVESLISCEGDDCGDLSTDCEISATWLGELDE